MLPIEKGCMAIIINTKEYYVGKSVTVGNYIGKVKNYNNNWETDIYHKDGYIVAADESQLMRIDGYKEEVKQKEEVIV